MAAGDVGKGAQSRQAANPHSLPGRRPSAMSIVLDSQKPLRESLLWQLQDAFYERVNIKAWSDAIVPNFVTSNCYVAQAYAKAIVSFATDLFAKCVAARRPRRPRAAAWRGRPSPVPSRAAR